MNSFANKFPNVFAENEKRRKQKYKDNVELRRNTVQSMLIRGKTQWEIVEFLGVSQPTVSRDIKWLRAAAKKELKVTLEKKFPEEYHKYLIGIDEVLRNAWDIALSGEVDKTRLDALQFVVECSKYRMDAIINPPVLTRFSNLSNRVKQFKGINYPDMDITRPSTNRFTVKKKEVNKVQIPE